MIVCRPATAADIREFYGHPIGVTVRAMAMLVDGKVEALAGLARWPRFYEFFSEIRPGARSRLHCVTVIRHLLRAAAWIRDCRLPVIAVASADEPGSVQLLERLGFVHEYGEFFKWHS